MARKRKPAEDPLDLSQALAEWEKIDTESLLAILGDVEVDLNTLAALLVDSPLPDVAGGRVESAN